jgi:hypothetical protein
MKRRKQRALKRPRLYQWIRIVLMHGRGFVVVYGDELGQVTGFDQHGIALHTRLGFAGERARRLEAVLRSPERFKGLARA